MARVVAASREAAVDMLRFFLWALLALNLLCSMSRSKSMSFFSEALCKTKCSQTVAGSLEAFGFLLKGELLLHDMVAAGALMSG